jgi:uncharacterized protein YdeI (YjbR/CyaY-like superfamily)
MSKSNLKDVEKFIDIFYLKDFTKWLQKNHDKEKKIGLVLHKKHTGKPTVSHLDLMKEAICFGWIDTTIRRIDESKFIRFFNRRSKNSRWSYNTLGYGKQLIKEKRMTPHGLAFYKEGLKKHPHDHGIPKDPEIPEDLKKELIKNKKAELKFNSISPSARRTYLRWLFRAKMPQTRKKRIDSIIGVIIGKKKPDDWMKPAK